MTHSPLPQNLPGARRAPFAPEDRAVLIANRGEIALRILRACRRLGLPVVAVYSTADADAAHVRLADLALCIGPAPARESYLDQQALICAALASGAQAVHPGYGFLSENAAFARRVTEAGLIFIGPRAETIAMMGDKIAAKAAMIAAGVPCVPGSEGAVPADPARRRALAETIGLPLLIKAAAGGGGRGMRVVETLDGLEGAIAAASEEAAQAFGDGTVYMERYLADPRHIEIQVLCDGHGQAVSLGARDCSMQRRHQKLIEEAPPPGIAADQIAALGARCTEACRRIGYRGAGTFEFLYEKGAFFFIEMNTRIQVEHPVTEMVTGIDLVAAQIDQAFGAPLGFGQDDITESGAAIELRINAETPFDGRPGPGVLTGLHLPGGPGIRVDTALAPGARVPPNYDSMVAKLIAHGRDRPEALARARAALAELQIAGIAENTALHRQILADPGFVAGGTPISHFAARIGAWRGQE